MPIRFKCSDCGSVLAIGSQKAGWLTICPNCKAKARVPVSSLETSPSSEEGPQTPNPHAAIDNPGYPSGSFEWWFGGVFLAIFFGLLSLEFFQDFKPSKMIAPLVVLFWMPLSWTAPLFCGSDGNSMTITA